MYGELPKRDKFDEKVIPLKESLQCIYNPKKCDITKINDNLVKTRY